MCRSIIVHGIYHILYICVRCTWIRVCSHVYSGTCYSKSKKRILKHKLQNMILHQTCCLRSPNFRQTMCVHTIQVVIGRSFLLPSKIIVSTCSIIGSLNHQKPRTLGKHPKPLTLKLSTRTREYMRLTTWVSFGRFGSI